MSLTGGKGMLHWTTRYMAVLGEPLYAMVQNLGQADSIFWTASATLPVFSQGFTTGPNAAGYRLQGIGVNIEGSGSNFPDGPTSVSVAVHADSGGKPGAKLFDLVSPTEYAAGHSFFEAPPGTTLAASTSYVLVWRHLDGTSHRLQATLGNSEDSGALAGFSIADAANWGSTLANQVEDSTGNALEIAVYTDRDLSPPKRVTAFDLHSDNDNPLGIWGNDDTFWIVQNSSTTDKLFAYNRSDGSRNSGQDFNTLNGAGNDAPTGICSDGTTMFVADYVDDKVYAYKMSDKSHDSGKDITLASANTKPEGVACNATHVWVVEDDTVPNNDIFAYKRSDGTEDTDVDFPDLDVTVNGTPLNANPRGLWQNGVTMFVVDDEDQTVYAWKMSDQSRESGKEIALDSANADPEGLWFDGRVLWVTDKVDDKLYVYDLPGAQPGNDPADGVPGVRTPTTEESGRPRMTVGTRTIFGDTIPRVGRTFRTVRGESDRP